MSDPITPDERAAMRERARNLRDLALNAEATPTERAYIDHVPRLLDALDTAEAEVARLRAATSPAWDEDVVRASGVQALTAVYERYGDDYLPDEEEMVDAVLAVVRRHLPVRPDRETVERALRDAGLVEVEAVHECGAEEVVHAHLRSVVNAVLRARADRIEKEK